MKKILLACLCFSLLSQVVEGSENTSPSPFTPFRPDSGPSLTPESVRQPEGASSSSSSSSDASSSAMSTAHEDVTRYKHLLSLYLKEHDAELQETFKSAIKARLGDEAGSNEEIYKKILRSWLKEKETKKIQQYETLFYAWVNVSNDLEVAAEGLMLQWSSNETDWSKKDDCVTAMLQLGNVDMNYYEEYTDETTKELSAWEKTERELKKGGKKVGRELGKGAKKVEAFGKRTGKQLERAGQNIGRVFGRHRH